MKKVTIAGLVLTLVFSFVSIAALADSGGNGNGGPARSGGTGYGSSQQDSPRGQVLGMNGLMNLELGDQQREQIRLLIQEYQSLIEAEREMNQVRIQEMRAALAEILDADVYDEDAAYDILVEQAEMAIERKLIRQRLQYQILHEILTEEQRNQLQNQWQNFAAFSDTMGQGPGPGEGLGDCPYM